MIFREWKCVILWRISIVFGGAFEQERAKKEKKCGARGGGEGFPGGLGHKYC